MLRSASLAPEKINVPIINGATSKHHAMRMERRRRNGSIARRIGQTQIAHVRLEAAQVFELRAVHADRMICAAGSKDRSMLVHAQSSEIARLSIPVEARDGFAHPKIPETHAAVAFGGDEFAQPTAYAIFDKVGCCA